MLKCSVDNVACVYLVEEIFAFLKLFGTVGKFTSTIRYLVQVRVGIDGIMLGSGVLG